MRTVVIPGTEIETSCLGMGCASLGSRISAAQGIRALEAAHEHGVTWYDTAPAYGAGEAEDILRPFLRPRRHQVFLCSKVGLAPPRHNDLVKLAYAMGRPLIGFAQGLRSRLRQVSATRNVRIPLTPELIEASIHRSLSRLGTDYLDVFALHDPDPADLGRDEIVRALENVKARGQARHVSVAGSFDAAASGAGHEVFGFFQLADDPERQPLLRLREMLGRPAGFVTHSVFGIGGAKDRVVGLLKARPELLQSMAASGYEGSPEEVAATLLMRRAFSSNSEGVVLASMFSGRHLAENIRMASLPVDPDAGQLLQRILAA